MPPTVIAPNLPQPAPPAAMPGNAEGLAEHVPPLVTAIHIFRFRRTFLTHGFQIAPMSPETSVKTRVPSSAIRRGSPDVALKPAGSARATTGPTAESMDNN